MHNVSVFAHLHYVLHQAMFTTEDGSAFYLSLLHCSAQAAQGCCTVCDRAPGYTAWWHGLSLGHCVSLPGDWFASRLGPDGINSLSTHACMEAHVTEAFVRLSDKLAVSDGPLSQYLAQC